MSEEIERLKEVLAVYSDCFDCGAVVADEALRIPDPFNAGRFKATCPSCGKENMRLPYPSETTNQLLELMIEIAEMNKPILAIILFTVIYESLVFRSIESTIS